MGSNGASGFKRNVMGINTKGRANFKDTDLIIKKE
jgi:hypothetical protein